MAVTDSHFKTHVFAVTLSLLLLLFTGMIGYEYFEGWNWFDALYMTFISISTVGYKEIAPLNSGGRFFTMFIILAGMVVIAMLSATVTSWFVRNELLLRRKHQKMKKRIGTLKDHTILCGAGDTGKTVITEFIRAKAPFVVIEENSQTINDLSQHYPEMLIIQGDATKDENLVEANIANASAVITALSIDADNLFVVVSARALNPKIHIISRAVEPGTEHKLYNAGANFVISPNRVEGIRMASVILRPAVLSFLEVIMNREGLSLRMEEIDIPESSPMLDKSLKELQIPQKTGLIVLAVKHGEDSRWAFNPSSQMVLRKNDRLIVLGETEKIEKLHSLLKS